MNITPLDWELIGTLDLYSIGQLPPISPEPVDFFLREKDVEVQSKQREKEKVQRLEMLAREEAMENSKSLVPLGHDSLHRIHQILCQLRSVGRAQSGLNGKGNDAKNLWIVKPAAKSRGRGISTFADLPKLLKYIEAGSGFSGQWIVQKYMENPLIIAKRKFDLRQWVVVTNWNPLTIWMFEECYARFSAQDYTVLDDQLDNSYVHLVNNSITKDHKQFNEKVVAENGVEVENCMWSHTQLSEWIKFKAKKVIILLLMSLLLLSLLLLLRSPLLKVSSHSNCDYCSFSSSQDGYVQKSQPQKVENQHVQESLKMCTDVPSGEDSRMIPSSEDEAPQIQDEEDKNENEGENEGENEKGSEDEISDEDVEDIEVEKEAEEKEQDIVDEEEEKKKTDDERRKVKKEEIDRMKEMKRQEEDQYDVMKNKIHPRMKEIAKWSLMCASEAIEHRRNSWELYGFDFMVDDDYNAWLIEINSSPACDYSTATTSKYVQKALVELLSVVLDVRQFENNLKNNSKGSRENYPDTGGWENIFKGVQMDMPAAAFGTDMTLKGEGLKLPKKQNSSLGLGQIPQGSRPNGSGGGNVDEGRLKRNQDRIPSSSSFSKTKTSRPSSSTNDADESEEGEEDGETERNPRTSHSADYRGGRGSETGMT